MAGKGKIGTDYGRILEFTIFFINFFVKIIYFRNFTALWPAISTLWQLRCMKTSYGPA
jgi:hypothetical protein